MAARQNLLHDVCRRWRTANDKTGMVYHDTLNVTYDLANSTPFFVVYKVVYKDVLLSSLKLIKKLWYMLLFFCIFFWVLLFLNFLKEICRLKLQNFYERTFRKLPFTRQQFLHMWGNIKFRDSTHRKSTSWVQHLSETNCTELLLLRENSYSVKPVHFFGCHQISVKLEQNNSVIEYFLLCFLGSYEIRDLFT